MSFADTFRKLVMPDLRRMIRSHAGFVAWEMEDFSEVVSAVMHEATRRGATHLPNELFYTLDEWICDELCKDVQQHIPLYKQCRPMLDWIIAVTEPPDEEVSCQTMTAP